MKEQFSWEMDDIRRDGATSKLNYKASYDHRIANMREENYKDINFQK